MDGRFGNHDDGSGSRKFNAAALLALLQRSDLQQPHENPATDGKGAHPKWRKLGDLQEIVARHGSAPDGGTPRLLN